MDTQIISFYIEETDAGERIDRYLARVTDASRSHIQNAIAQESILVNDHPVKPNYTLKCGDIITVIQSEPQPVDILPEDIPLDILYEDNDLLIVNKPKGMVVHPAPGHASGTLVNAVMYHCGQNLSGINGQLRPGIVHRIDKDTTGALVVCKNDAAHTILADLLKDHSITRRYVGIVIGHLPEEGSVDAPIGRDPKDRKKMCVTEKNSRRAVTHFKVLQSFKDYTYAEFTLETGRTHQIRVHMKHNGHPILGDTVYGPAKCPFRLEGQTLHARDIGFVHPSTGEYIEVSAPLPAYFTHLLEILSSGC
ncbi:MAG: RluA family pseudouridine synthase [Lachnospiraceae bacterium]|nr:RluA family pseudouridine synthase [Lachnospiraceae bacterium]